MLCKQGIQWQADGSRATIEMAAVVPREANISVLVVNSWSTPCVARHHGAVLAQSPSLFGNTSWNRTRLTRGWIHGLCHFADGRNCTAEHFIERADGSFCCEHGVANGDGSCPPPPWETHLEALNMTVVDVSTRDPQSSRTYGVGQGHHSVLNVALQPPLTAAQCSNISVERLVARGGALLPDSYSGVSHCLARWFLEGFVGTCQAAAAFALPQPTESYMASKNKAVVPGRNQTCDVKPISSTCGGDGGTKRSNCERWDFFWGESSSLRVTAAGRRPSGKAGCVEATWSSSGNLTCSDYVSRGYCSEGDYGGNWLPEYGIFDDYADVNGCHAGNTCSECSAMLDWSDLFAQEKECGGVPADALSLAVQGHGQQDWNVETLRREYTNACADACLARNFSCCYINVRVLGWLCYGSEGVAVNSTKSGPSPDLHGAPAAPQMSFALRSPLQSNGVPSRPSIAL